MVHGWRIRGAPSRRRAATDTAAWRRALDLAADGSFVRWPRARHDDDLFEKEFADRVTKRFGA